jgi:hypothetical protein
MHRVSYKISFHPANPIIVYKLYFRLRLPQATTELNYA